MNIFSQNKKTVIISILIICLIVVGLFIYYKPDQVKPLGQINYGYAPWPGVLPYIVAYEKGFFKAEGLDVNLIKTTSYTEQIADFISGRLDFVGDFALIDVVKKVSAGEKINVILATDYSNGADGIVSHKDIKNITDLKGKSVAVEKETLGEYLLYDALRKNNLNLSDVKIVNLSAQESVQAFIRGEVDAAVSYEPDLSLSLDQGQGNLLYTSVQSPGLIMDTLVFKPDFVTENPLLVEAVVRSYARAVDYIASNPADSYAVGAKYFDITSSEFEGQYKGIKQITLSENLSMMTYGVNSDSLHGLINQA